MQVVQPNHLTPTTSNDPAAQGSLMLSIRLVRA